jgi:hypothetical protein
MFAHLGTAQAYKASSEQATDSLHYSAVHCSCCEPTCFFCSVALNYLITVRGELDSSTRNADDCLIGSSINDIEIISFTANLLRSSVFSSGSQAIFVVSGQFSR